MYVTGVRYKGYFSLLGLKVSCQNLGDAFSRTWGAVRGRKWLAALFRLHIRRSANGCRNSSLFVVGIDDTWSAFAPFLSSTNVDARRTQKSCLYYASARVAHKSDAFLNGAH